MEGHILEVDQDGLIVLDTNAAQVEFSKDFIQVNCTKASIKVLELLLAEHKRAFEETKVYQRKSV